MKKVLAMVAVILLAVSFVTVVNAATEDEIISALSRTYTVNGQAVSIPSNYVKEAKRYLATYDVSAAEADQVIAKINEGVAYMQQTGKADVYAMSKEQKQELLSIAQDAASVANATLTYSNNGELTVIGEDGKVFATYTVKQESQSTFKQTGNDYAVYAVIGGIAVVAVAAGILVYRKNKVNA